MAEKTEQNKSKSPFKDISLFEKEIKDFANKFKTIVANQASRISDYFEMACFNYIVRFYELNGYKVEVQNLQKEGYRYKCSPSGIQSNFSYFSASIEIEGEIYEYEIQHNLAVQSSFDSEIFTNPDIAIIKKDTVLYSTTYYETNRRFSYVENSNLLSYCEVKHFNPFPELLFNFIGTLNELRKEYLIGDKKKEISPVHIAPSLMISGKGNKQTNRIKESLETRYHINIFYDLFYTADYTFSRLNQDQIKNAMQIVNE